MNFGNTTLADNSRPITIDVPFERTGSLLSKVLAITAAGFLVTAGGVATAPTSGSLLGFIVVIALIFGMRAAQKKSPALAMGLFFVLTYFMGWEIGPMIHQYIRTIGIGVVFNAAATTGVGMAAMGIVAYLFQINYRRVAGYATMALLGLILVGLVSMFFHFIRPDTYSWLTLIIFSFLTVADFARIRAGGDGQSAVSLALGIYLDGINLFLAALQLLSGRGRR